MKDKLFIAGLIILVIAALVYAGIQNSDCDDKGGILVKNALGGFSCLVIPAVAVPQVDNPGGPFAD